MCLITSTFWPMHPTCFYVCYPPPIPPPILPASPLSLQYKHSVVQTWYVVYDKGLSKSPKVFYQGLHTVKLIKSNSCSIFSELFNLFAKNLVSWYFITDRVNIQSPGSCLQSQRQWTNFVCWYIISRQCVISKVYVATIRVKHYLKVQICTNKNCPFYS